MAAPTRVIVVNFNAGEALMRCVQSVLAVDEPLHLIVADNDSTDGSCELLRARFGASQRLEILENASNLGFGRAVNACGLRAQEPWLLVLNPDCELRPGALPVLRGALESDASAALAGPRVVDGDGRVLRGTLRTFPGPLSAIGTASGLSTLARWLPALRDVDRSDEALPAETVQADAVSGACMLMRTEVFRALGGFDERFEMHFEDLDLMRRMHDHGWRCLFVPAATVVHDQGTSTRSRRWWVHRQKHLGMQRYFDKHASGSSAVSRALLRAGIWLHYVLTLPRVWLQA